MSFVEIERKIGYMLPKSANLPTWWTTSSNDDARRPQCKAWSEAGYDAFLITGKDVVRFTRIGSGQPSDRVSSTSGLRRFADDPTGDDSD